MNPAAALAKIRWDKTNTKKRKKWSKEMHEKKQQKKASELSTGVKAQ